MNVKNLRDATDWFSVLQTSDKTQTAVMILQPGQSSGDEPEAHEKSEQVLLVLEGVVEAEIEGQKKTMRERDVVVIPAGMHHKFTNNSWEPVITFNTYSPPEY